MLSFRLDSHESKKSKPTRRIPASRLLPILGLASAVGIYCGVENKELTAPTAAPQAPAHSTPVAIPTSLRALLMQKVQQSAEPEYALSADPARPEKKLLANSAQTGVFAQFDEEGVHVGSLRSPQEVAMTLALSAYGCQGALRKAESHPPRAQTHSNRAEYVRPGMTEWYVNSPLGIEQGFTVDKDPGCTASAKLLFEIDVSTQAKVALVGQGAQVHLEVGDPTQGALLHYSDLFALDADGKDLPARMVLEGRTLRLEVEAAGARYPVTVDPTLFEQKKLVASDKAKTDRLGLSVALSADGNTALVGSFLSDPGGTSDAGAAYVYTRTGSVWSEVQKLIASDKAAGDNFGGSVALSADGSAALVGAAAAAPGGTTQAGAAYAYTKSGGSFSSEQKLVASDKATGSWFGASVALSADGQIALVGASIADPGGLSNAGAAYAYTKSAGSFGSEQKIVASDKAADDNFGFSVALSADGSTALIGARQLTATGVAYAYTKSGGSFGSEQKIVASDKATSDQFGASVALSGDGSIALVGAPLADPGGTSGSGAAYAYTKSAGLFGSEQKLLASDKATGDSFGTSVGLSADGGTAIIGASGVTTGAGAAYIYTKSAGNFGSEQKLVASDRATLDKLGSSVALSTDASTILIGAPLASPGGISGAGAVYVFGILKPDGLTCAMGSECLSGSCADGVCCDTACGNSNDTDCQACSAAKKQSGSGGGSCGPAKITVVCRPADNAKGCDASEMCDGTTTNCPADKGTADTTLVCRAAAVGKLCDVAEKCDGTSSDCPADKAITDTTKVCRPAAGACDMAETCTGSSPDCPPDQIKAPGVQCKAAGLNQTCDLPDSCDGTRTGCPAKFAPAGTTGAMCLAPKSCNGFGGCS